MMLPAKRVKLLGTFQHNRRDSGNYSESCHSDVSEEQKRSKREAECERQEDKCKTLEGIESIGTTTSNDCNDVEVIDKTILLKTLRQSNIDAKSDELKRLLPITETEAYSKQNILSGELIANNDTKLEHSGHVFDRLLKHHSSITLVPPLHEKEGPCKAVLKKHTDVDVINRCDKLINQLQDITQKYFKLERYYSKVKKICYLMIVVNAVLLVLSISTVIPLLVVLSRTSNEASRHENGGNGYALAVEKQYLICFACTDLKPGTSFSLEKLLDVRKKDGKCCFKSITSVVTSLLRILGNTVADETKNVNHKIHELDKRLLQLEVGLAPDTSNVIGNILQVMAPKERTAAHLLSIKDVPVSTSHDAQNKFIKLRWSSSEESTVLVGKVQLTEDGLNVNVTSEAYYFFYTGITFMHKERDTYERKTPLRYLVYRKRGSISSYIHEAKLNCVFNELSQKHTVTTELILHLRRDDEIFVSVDDADRQFLATETGAHSIGLFEI